MSQSPSQQTVKVRRENLDRSSHAYVDEGGHFRRLCGTHGTGRRVTRSDVGTKTLQAFLNETGRCDQCSQQLEDDLVVDTDHVKGLQSIARSIVESNR